MVQGTPQEQAAGELGAQRRMEEERGREARGANEQGEGKEYRRKKQKGNYVRSKGSKASGEKVEGKDKVVGGGQSGRRKETGKQPEPGGVDSKGLDN